MKIALQHTHFRRFSFDQGMLSFKTKQKLKMVQGNCQKLLHTFSASYY